MSRSLTFCKSFFAMWGTTFTGSKDGGSDIFREPLFCVANAYPCSRLMRGAGFYLIRQNIRQRIISKGTIQWDTVSYLVKRNRLVVKSRGWEENAAFTGPQQQCLKGWAGCKEPSKHVGLSVRVSLLQNKTGVIPATGTSTHAGLVRDHMSWTSMVQGPVTKQCPDSKPERIWELAGPIVAVHVRKQYRES